MDKLAFWLAKYVMSWLKYVVIQVATVEEKDIWMNEWMNEWMNTIYNTMWRIKKRPHKNGMFTAPDAHSA